MPLSVEEALIKRVPDLKGTLLRRGPHLLDQVGSPTARLWLVRIRKQRFVVDIDPDTQFRIENRFNSYLPSTLQLVRSDSLHRKVEHAWRLQIPAQSSLGASLCPTSCHSSTLFPIAIVKTLSRFTVGFATACMSLHVGGPSPKSWGLGTSIA